MAKKAKLNIGNILVIAGFILALCAFICLAGAGATRTAMLGDKVLGTTSYNLAGFISGTYTLKVGDTSSTIKTGVSYFGIIAIVLTALGLVATLVGLLLKKKVIVIIGGILVLLSGISMFLLLVAGSNMADSKNVEVSFAEFWKTNELLKTSLGVGTIFYGILGILGGATTTVGAFLNK